MWPEGRPRQGLYDPTHEHDSCGVGLVAHIKGQPATNWSRTRPTCCGMNHRGACGCEVNTGDGAGILTALPHEFLSEQTRALFRCVLPEPGAYAAGNVFLPTDPAERAECKRIVEELIAWHGQRLIGWRTLPVRPDEANIGPSARQSMPAFEQLYVAASGTLHGEAFERQLYLIRKQASHRIHASGRLTQRRLFYVCSLSTQVMIYKGMLTPDQLSIMYPTCMIRAT